MKDKVPATVTFRTKVKEMVSADGARKNIIDYKLSVKRSDCDLKPHQHDYFNSDMFPSMLQRAYDAAIKGKRWCYLDALPGAVSIEHGSFLVTVKVRVMV